MTAQINIKIEESLKNDLDISFNKLGLSTTDALEYFLKNSKRKRNTI